LAGNGKNENLFFTVYGIFLFFFERMAFYIFRHWECANIDRYAVIFPVSSTNRFYLLKITFLAKFFLVFKIFLWNCTFLRRSFPLSSSCRSAKSPPRVPGQDSNPGFTMQRSLDWKQLRLLSKIQKMGYVSKGLANKLLPAKRYILKKSN
jgi:hypothetical protein